jgi:hypothetical protein
MPHNDDDDDIEIEPERPGEAESIGFGEQHIAQTGRTDDGSAEWPHRVQVAQTILAQQIGSDRLRREASAYLIRYLSGEVDS